MNRRSSPGRGLALAALALGLAACGQRTPGAPSHLAVWWWGEQEAPGAQSWMAETVEKYQSAHPDVRIETRLQSTDSLETAFHAAAAARHGPDIQSLWAGLWTLQEAWEDALVPTSSLMPESEYRHYIGNDQRRFEGKVWGVGLYLSGTSIAFNKDLFEKAGLDPDGDYSTWPAFLAACAQLTRAGITPLAGGLADGWLAGRLWQLLGRQTLDSAADMMQAMTGAAKLTDARYAAWWSKLAELKSKGCWNGDIGTIDYQQAQGLFLRGQAAMIVANDTSYPDWIRQVGKDKIGVMRVPVYGSGRLAHTYAVTTPGLCITSWSKARTQAADFLRFMHTAERLQAWYAATGLFPADDRFDAAVIALPQMRQVFTWIKQGPGPDLEDFIPPSVDEQLVTACRLLFAGTMDAAQCARQLDMAAAAWRAENPRQMENYRKWIAR